MTEIVKTKPTRCFEFLFALQFQDLLLAKMEEEKGSGEADDAAYILEEDVLKVSVPRVQQEMELELRIQTKHSAHNEK